MMNPLSIKTKCFGVTWMKPITKMFDTYGIVIDESLFVFL
ncbi:hypothetical protein CLV98_101689 [Dyadobacter jejuensis]|uniref:Uncharacterized protein n=1 Tax=Dyadobacter jejuensis TaxID=1082580 RepID=A0A316AS44_9BACT|nr:hypothetical protein CLV98_101689 [Dyadobacter jejuensis]